MKRTILTTAAIALATIASAQKVKPVTISFAAQDKSAQDVEIQFLETDTVIPLQIVSETSEATKTLKGEVKLIITEPTFGRITYR